MSRTLRSRSAAALLVGAFGLGSTGVAAGGQATTPMRRALDLLAAGRTAEARELLEGIVRSDPDHGPARLELARLAVEDERWDEAEAHLRIALRARPRRLFLVHYLLGRVHLARGAIDEAVAALREAQRRAPRFVPAVLLLGETLERRGAAWEALAVYRELLDGAAPDDASLFPAYLAAANLARKMGAADLALCYARAAASSRPEDGYARYLLAAVLEQRGDVDEAIAACEAALAAGFDEAAVYVTLGNLYHAKMRIGESIRALGRAVELDPEAAEHIASFALASLTSDDARALRSILERHVAAHPESPNALYALGAIALREGDLDRAGALFERLAAVAPDQAEVHYNLSLIYRARGDDERAEEALERFRRLEAAEREEWLRQNRAHARRVAARDRLAAGDAEGAVAALESLVEERTATAADLVALGRALLAAGRAAEALGWIERALEASPYDPEALEAAAAAAETLGRAEEAAAYRRRRGLLEATCGDEG